MSGIYLLKVNEKTLKRMLNLDIDNFEVVEIEDINDYVKVNILFRLLEDIPASVLARDFKINKYELKGLLKNGSKLDVNKIFQFKKERYYPAKDVIDMLMFLRRPKSKGQLSVDAMVQRIEKQLDKVKWEMKHLDED